MPLLTDTLCLEWTGLSIHKNVLVLLLRGGGGVIAVVGLRRLPSALRAPCPAWVPPRILLPVRQGRIHTEQEVSNVQVVHYQITFLCLQKNNKWNKATFIPQKLFFRTKSLNFTFLRCFHISKAVVLHRNFILDFSRSPMFSLFLFQARHRGKLSRKSQTHLALGRGKLTGQAFKTRTD